MKFDKIWVKPSAITSYVANPSGKAFSVEVSMECGTKHRVLMSQEQFEEFESILANISNDSTTSVISKWSDFANKWSDFANSIQPAFQGYMPSGQEDLDLEPLQEDLVPSDLPLKTPPPHFAQVPEDEDKKPPRKNTKKDA